MERGGGGGMGQRADGSGPSRGPALAWQSPHALSHAQQHQPPPPPPMPHSFDGNDGRIATSGFYHPQHQQPQPGPSSQPLPGPGGGHFQHHHHPALQQRPQQQQQQHSYPNSADFDSFLSSSASLPHAAGGSAWYGDFASGGGQGLVDNFGLASQQYQGLGIQQPHQQQQHPQGLDAGWMQYQHGGPGQHPQHQAPQSQWQQQTQWQPPASMASSQSSGSSGRDDLQSRASGGDETLLFLQPPGSSEAHPLQQTNDDALIWLNAQQQQQQQQQQGQHPHQQSPSAFGAPPQTSIQRSRRPDPLHITTDMRSNGNGAVGSGHEVGSGGGDLSNVPLAFTPMPQDSRTPRGPYSESHQASRNEPHHLAPAFNYMVPPSYGHEQPQALQPQSAGGYSHPGGSVPMSSTGSGGPFDRPDTSSSGQASIATPHSLPSAMGAGPSSFGHLQQQQQQQHPHPHAQAHGYPQQSPASFQQSPLQFASGSELPGPAMKQEHGYPTFFGQQPPNAGSNGGGAGYGQHMSGASGGLGNPMGFARYGGGGSGNDMGLTGPHATPQQHFSEHTRRESDPTRLSMAMANTQLAPPREPPHGTTPTIIEEEEDGPVSLQHARSGPSSRQASRPQVDLEQQRASFFAAQQLNSHQQIQVQRPQPSGPSAPTVLQRRYKPAVRPSTFQQLSTMNLDEEEERLRRDPSSTGSDTFETLIDEMIRHYITSPSRLGLGERTVLIMTSKVAQKSYGAEKRFLCPPPMVLLIGSSWWHACRDPSMLGIHAVARARGGGAPTTLIPPRVNIGMSGESNSQEGVLEWATSSGRLIDVGNPSSEMAVSGRCIGKQLYITDIDEKRRSCETLVRVALPGPNAVDSVHLGTFASKPIKIISKPSKKRQSNRNTELGIQHGSIVSLFHRLRSQTVSTRYLCVSGAPTWFKGSDGQPFLTLEQHDGPPSRVDPPSCFVAKMTSWDPFVVYLVDSNKKPTDPNAPPSKPPVMGYPPPPPSAMVIPPGSTAPTVHYNQRIVLQCLNTAVVSPVMVIRKVDKATTVTGGSAAAGSLEDEALGDPVSQLHKIALEVVEDPSAPAPSVSMTMTGEPSTPGTSGPFLACLNECVGMRRPQEQRKWVWSHLDSMPTTPLTPAQSQQHESALKMAGIPPSPTAFAAAYAAAQTRSSLNQARPRGSTGGTGAWVPPSPVPYTTPQQQQQQQQQQTGQQSSDGGKVKRPRRVSSSIVPSQGKGSTGSTPGKGRRRGQSLSMVEWQKEQARQWQQQQQQAQQQGGGSSDMDHSGPSSLPASASASESSVGAPSGAAWTVDIADSDVWTIVGTDIARHTFYIPPRLAGGIGAPPTDVPDSGIAHLIATPAPANPVTPLPVLHSFLPPSAEDGGQPFVTLYGENFSDDLYIYFGDWRSTNVQLQSSDTLLCAPPPPASEGFDVPTIRLPVILVRKDGVIFPSECIYST